MRRPLLPVAPRRKIFTTASPPECAPHHAWAFPFLRRPRRLTQIKPHAPISVTQAVSVRAGLTWLFKGLPARAVRECKLSLQAWRHPVEEGAEFQRHWIARRIDDVHRQRLQLEGLQ